MSLWYGASSYFQTSKPRVSDLRRYPHCRGRSSYRPDNLPRLDGLTYNHRPRTADPCLVKYSSLPFPYLLTSDLLSNFFGKCRAGPGSFTVHGVVRVID